MAYKFTREDIARRYNGHYPGYRAVRVSPDELAMLERYRGQLVFEIEEIDRRLAELQATAATA